MKHLFHLFQMLIVGVTAVFAQELFITMKVDSTETGSSSHGKGTGYAILSSDKKSLQYRVTVNAMNGNITASHFHYKPTGGVVHTVTFTGKTATGTWNNIPDSLVNALFNNDLYLNIHSSTNAGGELRGDLDVQQFGFPIVINGANAGTASAGQGTGYAYFETINASTWVTDIRYRATYAGLSGNITASHFHELPGGSVVYTVVFADSTADGSWTGFSDANLLKFYKRQMYLNIHSSFAAGGEVRGNLSPVGELAFAGIMDGAQASTASAGKGTVWSILHPDMSMRYGATFAKLGGSFSAAHFHTSNGGGVVKDLSFSRNTTAGIWTSMSDENVTDLLKGRIYLNVHSSVNPGGEIRANMRYVPGLFTGTLDGTQAGTASTAKGTVWVDVSGDSAMYHATIAGLNGTFSAAHFHTTDGGGVVKPVVFVDSTTTGYWNLESRLVDLVRGKLYLNVHSSVNPGGEIRGDLKLGSGIVTSVRRISGTAPTHMQLLQNYPNPFNPSTTIEFAVPATGRTVLKVYNLVGQEVATLFDGIAEAGQFHQATFMASHLASGIYLARLQSGGERQMRKLVLMK